MQNKYVMISLKNSARTICTLMYITNCTKPDNAYIITKLSKYTQNPNREH